MAARDQGRIASDKAYRTLAPTRKAVDDAVIVLRAVDPGRTALRAEISEVVGQLEVLYRLVDYIVTRLADMASSDDWVGHRLRDD